MSPGDFGFALGGKMYFLAGLLHERMWSHLIRKERRQTEGLVLQLEIQLYSNSPIIKPSLTFLSCQHNVLLRGCLRQGFTM